MAVYKYVDAGVDGEDIFRTDGSYSSTTTRLLGEEPLATGVLEGRLEPVGYPLFFARGMGAPGGTMAVGASAAFVQLY